MSLLLNRAKETTTTSGTGTVTVSGAVSPFQTWAAAQAGAPTTRKYSYLIEEGTAWEIGEGVFNEGAGTITRNLIASSTGALLNLAGTGATIACVAKAADSPQVIGKVVCTAGQTLITFDDIPQDFTDLELSSFGELNQSANASPTLRCNNDSGANYDIQRQYAQATTNTADQTLGGTSFSGYWAFQGTIVTGPGNSSGTCRFLGYSNTVFQKAFEGRFRHPSNNTTGQQYVLNSTGNYRSTSAITRIDIEHAVNGFAAGTTFTLRGIP